MKINFILPSIGKSGGALVVFKYAELFSCLGNDVKVYIPIIEFDLHRSNILKNKLRQLYRTFINYYNMKKVDSIDYLSNINLNIEFVWRITNNNIRNADAIIATAWPTAYAVNKLTTSKGKKYYFIQDYEIWDNQVWGLNSYKLPMTQISISNWISDSIYKAIGKSPEFIIYNGIDTKIFYPQKKKTHEKRIIKCLLMYHSLPKKGFDQGLIAFYKAKQVVGNIQLTVFGLSKWNSTDKSILFYQNPNTDELRKLYSESDIYIFPSIEEGWGLTAVEAMACKCAVVASNVGCMMDIGIDGENVLLSNPKDTDAMAHNIVNLVQNENLRNEISNNAYDTAKNLDWKISANKFLHILDKESNYY